MQSLHFNLSFLHIRRMKFLVKFTRFGFLSSQNPPICAPFNSFFGHISASLRPIVANSLEIVDFIPSFGFDSLPFSFFCFKYDRLLCKAPSFATFEEKMPKEVSVGFRRFLAFSKRSFKLKPKKHKKGKN